MKRPPGMFILNFRSIGSKCHADDDCVPTKNGVELRYFAWMKIVVTSPAATRKELNEREKRAEFESA